jgi:hypothetical protein
MGLSRMPSSQRGPVAKPGRSDYRALKKQARMKGVEEVPMTKAEKRVARALGAAKDRGPLSVAKSAAHKGVSENPLKKQLERNLLQKRRGEAGKRGTSIARVNRHGEEEEEQSVIIDDGLELDRNAAASSLGIASPLPRSILRPTKGIVKKR